MTLEVKLKRVQCNYQADTSRFLLECDFSKQYFQYYRKRLDKTRPLVEINCQSKWDKSLPIYNLAQLAALTCNDQSYIEADLSSQSSPESSFEFSKRLRRSPASPVSTNDPQTSTQKLESSDISTPQIRPRRLTLTPTPITPVQQPSRCIVIGTIFKRMKLQPDVVEELSQKEFAVRCENYHGHFTSQDDQLILEDPDESISLTGNIDPRQFVTGVVVGLLGRPIDAGSRFHVEDICYAEPDRNLFYDESELTAFLSQTIEKPIDLKLPVYLMVVSSLGFHPDMNKRGTLTGALQDMIDFIWGGAKYANDERSSRVGRILVLGDNVSEERLISDEDSSQKVDIASRMKKSRQVKQYPNSIQAFKHMDNFFAELSKTINVDVMPGSSDPSSHLFPQQPFHPCMFPKSCMFETFNCTTNPHHAIYNDSVEILATSGQNIDIVSKFSELSDPIDIMKCHLKWGNCAPSAPDNLYSVPYEDDDPFVINFIPEIYIAGCQDYFRTDYYYYRSSKPRQEITGSPLDESYSRRKSQADQSQLDSSLQGDDLDDFSKEYKRRTLLITVPRFNETFTCVLINLVNLKSHLISFGS